MKTQLKFLHDFLTEIQSQNVQSHKIEILEKYKNLNEPLLRKFLSFTYDFDKTYGVTSTNVEKYLTSNKEVDGKQYDDIFDLLSDLKERKITGYQAIQTVIKNNDQFKTIYFLINKDLKANISTKIINKVLPGCIKEWNVALANKIQDQKTELDFDSGEWIFERKLDGVRCIGTMDESGNIHFISRQGREFTTLENLKQPVKNILLAAKKKYKKSFVIDGECCMMNDKGDEDFSAVMQEITMKNHTIEKPKYVVFDLILEDEFFQKEPSTEKYIDRLERLEKVVSLAPSNKVDVVANVKQTNKQVFEQWQQIVKDQNWEGLCIRLADSVFQAKRTNDLIKVKSFFDEEFIVKDIEIGQMKMLRNGKMEEVECVKSLVIEDDSGLKFNCGSGLSEEQRIDWLNHPDKIIGQTVTIQYFEKTVDKKTNIPSLRFPTLKMAYTKDKFKDGRQI